MPREVELDNVIVYMRGHSFKTTKQATRLLLECAEIGLDVMKASKPDDAIMAHELMIAFQAGIEDPKREEKENVG